MVGHEDEFMRLHSLLLSIDADYIEQQFAKSGLTVRETCVQRLKTIQRRFGSLVVREPGLKPSYANVVIPRMNAGAPTGLHRCRTSVAGLARLPR